MKLFRLVIFPVLGLFVAAPVFAAEEAPYADTLTGNWGGARSKLANKGVEVELNYTGDLAAVTDGGKKRPTTYLDLIELRTNLDGEKLLGIKGNTMSISVIDNNGAHVNGSNVGGTQGIDNAEVSKNGVRLFEAWMNQEFLDGRAALLVGLHDLNSEFLVTDMSGNFITPTMQVPQSIAQSGRNGPSIYPATSLAARVKFLPTLDSYVLAAAYDGVPSDPDNSREVMKLDDKDGFLLISEIGYAPKLADGDAQLNKIALGVWNYTVGMDDLTKLDSNGNAAKSTQQGVYALSSYQFYHDKKAGRAMGGFVRGGIADGDVGQVDWDVEAGLVANGFVPARPEGEIGLGVSYAHNADKYITSQSGAADRAETNYELYYRDHVVGGVSLQPTLQYVVNPGTDQTTDDATIVGLRVNAAF